MPMPGLEPVFSGVVSGAEYKNDLIFLRAHNLSQAELFLKRHLLDPQSPLVQVSAATSTLAARCLRVTLTGKPVVVSGDSVYLHEVDSSLLPNDLKRTLVGTFCGSGAPYYPLTLTPLGNQAAREQRRIIDRIRRERGRARAVASLMDEDFLSFDEATQRRWLHMSYNMALNTQRTYRSNNFLWAAVLMSSVDTPEDGKDHRADPYGNLRFLDLPTERQKQWYSAAEIAVRRIFPGVR